MGKKSFGFLKDAASNVLSSIKPDGNKKDKVKSEEKFTIELNNVQKENFKTQTKVGKLTLSFELIPGEMYFFQII